ncbi:MAG: ATP-binding protein [Pseudomonadota bacterium]
MTAIDRSSYLERIEALFEIFPIVALLGARQVGKSTLSRQYIKTLKEKTHLGQPVHFFDLENDRDLTMLNDPQLALESLEGLIVIDEIQRRPDLFPNLRYLVDHKPQRYLILGSASRDLLYQSSETLAGRIGYIELLPLSMGETDLPLEQHLTAGGFPKSILASNPNASYVWRQNYIKTYLERDLDALGFDVEPATMRRFWQLLAHYHGQIFNATEIATNLGISVKTAQRYMHILSSSFMVTELKPWHENLGKRQVKRSKIYFNDTGLLCALLGIKTYLDLLSHPKLGAIWEGFGINAIVQKMDADRDDCYFWATSNQAELDLMLLKDGKRYGYELKFTSKPTISKSMRIALADLKLDELNVVVPYGREFVLSPKIKTMPLAVEPLTELT